MHAISGAIEEYHMNLIILDYRNFRTFAGQPRWLALRNALAVAFGFSVKK
jgi:hypothetical protein